MRFYRRMRFVVLLLSLAISAFAAVPPELEAALKSFRPDPPRGWSFTQTTAAEGKSTVERCDAARPEFDRWSLVQVDGRAPDAEELARYAENRSRRSRGGTAPRIVEQLDLATLETVREADADGRVVYRCRLRPGEATDKTAAFLRATLTLHRPSQTIEVIELANVDEFSPALGVTIAEVRTVMSYRLPESDTPALPRTVVTRQRGTAFWFKSLDAEMTVTFTDYERARKR